jgi:hypothetical protein
LIGAGIAEKPLDFMPDLMADEALKWVKEQKISRSSFTGRSFHRTAKQ